MQGSWALCDHRGTWDLPEDPNQGRDGGERRAGWGSSVVGAPKFRGPFTLRVMKG